MSFDPGWLRRSVLPLLVVAFAGLAGCSGSGGGEAVQYDTPSGTTMPPKSAPESRGESSRFLAQSTFGATSVEMDRVIQVGYVEWIEDQFRKPVSQLLPLLDQRVAATPGLQLSSTLVHDAFWQASARADDQLRQRVAYALSQIFVVSLANGTVSGFPRGMASYYDMLSRNAFLNFRQLLEEVSLHPMMGIYLTHLRNQKEDPARGRAPDENYAREIMQLFTIGLHQLNPDGTVKLDTRNEPIETYTNDDITGLAKVFTGWGWSGPDTSDATWNASGTDPDRPIRPMQAFPKYHSTSEKRFLGLTIAARTPADGPGDLKAALDHLFNHPNVAPFFSKLLIQRLVTSNPSPAYVGRVAAQFENNGLGVRGDLRAVVRAILFDVEARDLALAQAPSAGKLREPALRLTQWMRAFKAGSGSGNYTIGVTDSVQNSLGQTPLRAPTVFNFYRAGYVPPKTPIADAGLASPEFQITHETSVVGWLNLMRSVVERGIGTGSPRDVLPDYAEEIALADQPRLLVARIDELLLHGQMPDALRTKIETAVASVAIPANNANSAQTARRNRVYLAVYLALAAPDYLAQR